MLRSTRAQRVLSAPDTSSCSSLCETARPRGFFPVSSSSSCQEHYGHGTVRSEQGWDCSLEFQGCGPPSLFVRLLCRLDPSSFVGSPEGTLGLARVFVLFQAGSRLSGGPGTPSPQRLTKSVCSVFAALSFAKDSIPAF